MSTLSKLQTYMKGRKALLPSALALSALSALTSMIPFILIWFIVKELFRETSNYNTELVYSYAIWAAISAIFSILLYFVALSFSHLAAFRVETNMRKYAMKKLIKMPLGFFDQNTSGKIRKIIDENASITHGFLAHQMPDLAGTILIPLVSLVLVFVFDWRLGLACLVPIVISTFIMGFMMGKRGRYFMQKYMNSLEEMNTEAVEYVRGIPVVKVFQQTIYSFKNFYSSIIKYKDMVKEYTKMWQTPMSAYTVIINGFIFFLVPVAIILISNGDSAPKILLDVFLYFMITPVFSVNIMRSMYLNQAMGQAGEAINRVESLLNEPILKESANPQKMKKFDVKFSNVSFTYSGANKKAVDGISFTIPEGKTVALVGASGSGKTTIARLLPRFWDVESGEISIGGANIKDIEHNELMNNISFVFQNTHLFKTTLLDNIRMGNEKASLEDVEKALDLAQCKDIINKQTKGLNTKIGSEGTYLSGGEQQRIALARAILKNAPIVVLDEATAFTDPDNEHLILQALGILAKGKTVLMIAHRLTSVKDADSILVIDKGKILEQGSHEDLLNKNGVYAKMWHEYQQTVKWTIKKEENHA